MRPHVFEKLTDAACPLKHWRKGGVMTIRAEIAARAGRHHKPESVDGRALRVPKGSALSKAARSARLGPKEVPGQLNTVIRSLLAKLLIEYTVPEKPNSRLRKHRLTGNGRQAFHKLTGGGK